MSLKEKNDEIKELKEKHEKVDDDFQEVVDYMAGHNDCDVYGPGNVKHSEWIIEDIQKLKEEIEKLKADKVYMEKQFNELKANACKGFDDLLENTNKEIEKLKEEKEKLCWVAARNELAAENNYLKVKVKDAEIEELKKDKDQLDDKLLDVEETIRVAIASRLSSFFPDEKMGDHEFAEDCDIAHNLNGEDLVKMIDEWR
jgi:DNA repair exonuclease SbcCD ATPase subunit